MSYFDDNYDEKSFKKELDKVVKMHLKKAASYKLGEPLALMEAKCAIALSETEDFHKALIDSLTEKEKSDVSFYSCNFFTTMGGCTGEKVMKLWNDGKKDMAIKAYKHPWLVDQQEVFQ